MIVIIEKLATWGIFGVILSALPIIFDILRPIYASDNKGLVKSISYSWVESVSHGELNLVTATICAAAAGELFGGHRRGLGPILSGGSAIIILVFCTWLYTELSAAARQPAKVDKAIIAKLSLMLFVLGVFCSGACVALSV